MKFFLFIFGYLCFCQFNHVSLANQTGTELIHKGDQQLRQALNNFSHHDLVELAVRTMEMMTVCQIEVASKVVQGKDGTETLVMDQDKIKQEEQLIKIKNNAKRRLKEASTSIETKSNSEFLINLIDGQHKRLLKQQFLGNVLNVGSDTIEGLVDAYTTIATPVLNTVFPGLGNLICGVIDGVYHAGDTLVTGRQKDPWDIPGWKGGNGGSPNQVLKPGTKPQTPSPSPPQYHYPSPSPPQYQYPSPSPPQYQYPIPTQQKPHGNGQSSSHVPSNGQQSSPNGGTEYKIKSD